MLVWSECRACASDFTVHLQEIALQRQGRTAPQIFCMECNSLFHTSDYGESEAQWAADAQFLQAHKDGSLSAIVDYLQSASPGESVYEAGCGVGDLLIDLSAAGLTASGIDPNPAAVGLATGKGAIAVRGYFAPLTEPVDAIICVDVMEHLERPRPFFRDIVASVKPGGVILVRVPEVEARDWHWLRGAEIDTGFDFANPFRDNSVHITHFSRRGLLALAEGMGATYERTLPDAAVHVFRA